MKFIVVNIIIPMERYAEPTGVQYVATCATREECRLIMAELEEKWRKRANSRELLGSWETAPNLHIVDVPSCS